MVNGLELRMRYVMAELSHQIYGTETTKTPTAIKSSAFTIKRAMTNDLLLI